MTGGQVLRERVVVWHRVAETDFRQTCLRDYLVGGT